MLALFAAATLSTAVTLSTAAARSPTLSGGAPSHGAPPAGHPPPATAARRAAAWPASPPPPPPPATAARRAAAWPAGPPITRPAAVAAGSAAVRVGPTQALRLAAAATAGGAGPATRPLALASAPDPAGDAAPGRDRRWRWPLAGRPEVVRAFDPPDSPYGRGHRGVDLAARPGAAVLAAGPGTVGWAGILAGRGVVSVRHPGGLRTTYEPVTAGVRAGQAVAVGDRLGSLTAGHPGCPRPACLHWGLLRGAVYLDPLRLLRGGPVRLLPLAGSVPPPPAGSGGRIASAVQPASAPPGGHPDRHALMSPVTTATTLGLGVLWAVIVTRRRPP